MKVGYLRQTETRKDGRQAAKLEMDLRDIDPGRFHQRGIEKARFRYACAQGYTGQ